MVLALHAAGIEVILDVVYNHTAEGDQFGPTLSLRGIDNPSYYRLAAGDQRRYVDFTGCGNTLNAGHPEVLHLILDSLRYWVTDMHVDGFRFDLASALARGMHAADRLSSFFDLIHQDPVVSAVKLIAEPWDLGEGGYQVGNFPVLWTEWNGKYRDAVRDFWRGKGASLAEMGYRLTGSSDLYQGSARKPSASINFVTAHDGFTLRDLVSYDRKHNEANGEHNRDGTDDNRSWNCGVEGDTDDPDVLALRRRQQRNFLATLFLSQGVPMLVAGDELGRTQRGNNNGYCQDNEVSWVDWDLGADGADLLEYTRRLLRLRRDHPVFRRRRFFQGRPIHGRRSVDASSSGLADIGWFGPDGREMTERQWAESTVRALGMFLNGDEISEPGPRGQRIVDDSFLVLLNGPNPVGLPAAGQGVGVGLRAGARHRRPPGGRRLPGGGRGGPARLLAGGAAQDRLSRRRPGRVAASRRRPRPRWRPGRWRRPVAAALDSSQVPMPDHRLAQAEGEGDLGQGAELAAHGHHHVGGADDEQVAGLAQPGGHGHVDVGVGLAAVVAGEDADRSRPPAARAPRHTASMTPPSPPQTTTAPRVASSRPELLGHGQVVGAGVAGADHRHVGRRSRAVAQCPRTEISVAATRPGEHVPAAVESASSGVGPRLSPAPDETALGWRRSAGRRGPALWTTRRTA